MKEYSKYKRAQMNSVSQLTAENRKIKKEYPIHWHNHFEIEIMLSGKGCCEINDTKYDFAEYNIFLLTPTDFHNVKAENTISLINISFSLDMIGEKDMLAVTNSKRKSAFSFSGDDYTRILSAAKLLKHEYETAGECQKELLHYILNKLLHNNGSETNEDENLAHYNSIKKATVFMEMHFRENITLKTIADDVGYHPAYFSEVFKKITGESYIESLTKLRLSYAKTMLLNGSSVTDACFLSGFGSLSNFYTSFKKRYNIAPSNYSKSMQENQ